jgi:hypothetical protein
MGNQLRRVMLLVGFLAAASSALIANALRANSQETTETYIIWYDPTLSDAAFEENVAILRSTFKIAQLEPLKGTRAIVIEATLSQIAELRAVRQVQVEKGEPVTIRAIGADFEVGLFDEAECDDPEISNHPTRSMSSRSDNGYGLQGHRCLGD